MAIRHSFADMSSLQLSLIIALHCSINSIQIQHWYNTA